MTTTETVDVVDAVAGLAPGSALWKLRRERPEIVSRTAASHDAALTPRETGGLGHAERAALACRMARLNADPALAAHYAAMLARHPADDELRAIAAAGPGETLSQRRRAIVRHVDRVTRDPKSNTRADIEALTAAGIPVRDIVSLSQLIAFVNYQQRVIAGLRLLQKTSSSEA